MRSTDAIIVFACGPGALGEASARDHQPMPSGGAGALILGQGERLASAAGHGGLSSQTAFGLLKQAPIPGRATM